MDREALIIENLAKNFGGRSVLVEMNLTVRKGECLALLGPSGCGKTTLLRLIAGLDDADAGCIRLNGQVASDPVVLLPPNRRGIGMLFQDLALWPHMTAWQNVEFMLPATVRGRRARKERASQILQTVHLKGRDNGYPHQLSRGQQQRLALARALAGEPAILLLDEPFASQDSDLKAQMVEMLRQIRQTTGMTTIFVTHTTQELPFLADRVAKIDAGIISQILTIDEFKGVELAHAKSGYEHL